MTNFSINGFGRIGRSATRVWLASHLDDFNLCAINTSGSQDVSGWAYLLKYDTAYGPLPYPITSEELQKPDQVTDENPLLGYITVEHPKRAVKIPILAQRDPAKIPWSQFGAEVVIECTGAFTSLEKATLHLQGGAKMVVLSAPPNGEGVPTALLGVNEQEVIGKDKVNTISVISNASCTTNSIAPVADLLHEKLGILKAMLTTVHGYTDDQNLQDNSHRDLRRGRAAAANIIPTSTGAAIAATQAIPELKGLFDGIALRVPVITGSITDFTFITQRATSVEEVNQIFIDAANTPRYKNILAVTDEPMVSSDVIGRSESSVVDLKMTRVVDGTMVKVLAWYDNEWGYANRLIEETIKVSQSLEP
ncbi:MAG: Glyceraldehyde-3-phosphate dehydrogenase [Candidatus Collierbacteria bacterium GW2011_GWB1_45_35]|uniref:Glyceraldehyde-3-phosphate dehydrogenase n=2 Tax=Candidatus Collieribacteriota TaxID=1752725 RepID=A0A837IFN8_9BACT|nr:MAG: Glyceraldehyde-3-phosphate dehydrogenase [Microgenomates group bacterium GW2011_GWC1_44_23]KKT96025.1 MAG: Glyceraldehyde-3-phosphate dehydrogenase [Candidatus Collierbacteria bacterium GW2011_GWA1_45_15]KKU01102.1 MAG: Glyceraldehyde-3-phosphate dehydrogenase [Candidatus Collierbacteria bacterium GW2011_GWB2_45_17]KKU05714.1 MAG: Glyceraldehyde-3-phosphate dehydrogenase [Candidatus Collierbacteria bacterium GW2011_GWB1_45_35]KKU08087.1 MAG: Glyceraldehyde-3-phosphate dehydrogenase [Can